MNELVKIADLRIYNVLNTYHIYADGGFKVGFGKVSLSDALRSVANILDRLYVDTENGDVVSYAELYEQWDHDFGGMRTTSSASNFQEYLSNATDKDGFLERIEK